MQTVMPTAIAIETKTAKQIRGQLLHGPTTSKAREKVALAGFEINPQTEIPYLNPNVLFLYWPDFTTHSRRRLSQCSSALKQIEFTVAEDLTISGQVVIRKGTPAGWSGECSRAAGTIAPEDRDRAIEEIKKLKAYW